MTVTLAVLLGSLLLLTGVAFGASYSCCEDYCYVVIGTDLTNSANSFTQHWSFCGNSPHGGTVCNETGPVPLFNYGWFLQGLNDQLISLDIGLSNNQGGYMTFHGSGDSIFNGLYYNGTDQYKIHGIEEECPS